jgi:cytochrome P450
MNSPCAAKPDHVPAHLAFDFDIYDFEVEGAEYQLGLHRLQQEDVPEIFWTPRNGGHWVVTRSHDISAVLADPAHFSSRQITVPATPAHLKMPPLAPVQSDPPDHMKYRGLLMAALSPKAVQGLGEQARELAIELIDSFRKKGECEFIADFAHHLPITIFMKLVDLPASDRDYLMEVSEAAVRGASDKERNDARMKIGGYSMQKVMERRAAPGSDLISTLARAEVDGKALDDFTVTGMVSLLLMAGLDTVASTLGFFARFLALNPAHRKQLIADPSLVPNAVEELLRRYPVANLAREINQDVTLGGVEMKVGDMLLIPTALDGLDDRRFEEPLAVDFKRNKPVHATFGGGVHRCMGSMLARTELRIFLEEWLKRIPDFEIRPGASIKVSARSVATIDSLPLVWAPASTR